MIRLRVIRDTALEVRLALSSSLLGKADQNVQGVDFAKLAHWSSQTDGYPLSSEDPNCSRQLPSPAAASYR